MGCGGEFRRWDELIPDILGKIFGKLTIEETLTVVPRVCKSWGRAVMGPYCWIEIDIEEWCRLQENEGKDRMVRMLLDRSGGSSRKIRVSCINDEIFSVIANQGRSLQTLCVPRSVISNTIVVDVAEMFSNVTVLDVSYCMNIGAEALEAFGRNCRFLSELRRVMHPIEVSDEDPQDDEALAIAHAMPNLKHLEIAYLVIGTQSVVEILNNCTHLEHLDVRGCWHVELDDKLVKKYPNVQIIGPNVVDSYYMDGWDDWENCSALSSYIAWEFVIGDDDEFDDDIYDDYWEEEGQQVEAEMWFYDDGELMDDVWDWSHSP